LMIPIIILFGLTSKVTDFKIVNILYSVFYY
jgi:hypothetical protein